MTTLTLWTSVPTRNPSAVRSSSTWLRGLRVYLGCIAVGNLIWESLQLQLYTLWATGTVGEQIVAVTHCWISDVLIALSALTLALLIGGDRTWPVGRFWHVAAFALIFGIAFNFFSEWLNVGIRASWTYSEQMPVVSAFGSRIGISPLLQWIVVPAATVAITKCVAWLAIKQSN
jgi:hypothetical protein